MNLWGKSTLDYNYRSLRDWIWVVFGSKKSEKSITTALPTFVTLKSVYSVLIIFSRKYKEILVVHFQSERWNDLSEHSRKKRTEFIHNYLNIYLRSKKIVVSKHNVFLVFFVQKFIMDSFFFSKFTRLFLNSLVQFIEAHQLVDLLEQQDLSNICSVTWGCHHICTVHCEHPMITDESPDRDKKKYIYKLVHATENKDLRGISKISFSNYSWKPHYQLLNYNIKISNELVQLFAFRFIRLKKRI